MAETIYVLTGATSGMGLHVAERLADRSNSLFIVGARQPHRATGLQAVVPTDHLILLPLDVSRLASVAAFAAGVKDRLEGRAKLAGIICNAGLQIVGPSRLTEDGVDETGGMPDPSRARARVEWFTQQFRPLCSPTTGTETQRLFCYSDLPHLY